MDLICFLHNGSRTADIIIDSIRPALRYKKIQSVTLFGSSFNLVFDPDFVDMVVFLMEYPDVSFKDVMAKCLKGGVPVIICTSTSSHMKSFSESDFLCEYGPGDKVFRIYLKDLTAEILKHFGRYYPIKEPKIRKKDPSQTSLFGESQNN